MRTGRDGGLAQSDDFGMRGRVIGGNRPVVAAADDRSVADHDGPDGHFALLFACVGEIESEAHEILVG
ncbi:hypothetical protein D3C83_83450 [compost metagenome]